MLGALMLAFLSAALYVMYWMIRNDGSATLADQKGFLRMMPPQVPSAEASAPQARPGTAGLPRDPLSRTIPPRRMAGKPVAPAQWARSMPKPPRVGPAATTGGDEPPLTPEEQLAALTAEDGSVIHPAFRRIGDAGANTRRRAPHAG